MKTTIAALGVLLAVCGAVFLFAPKANLPVANALAPSQTGVETSKPQFGAQPQEAHIFAAGDIMLDRQIRLVSDENGGDFVFSCIDPLLKSADFAVANLEGPITGNPSRSLGSVPGSTDNYYFTFPTTTGALLARHHFKAVDIGN